MLLDTPRGVCRCQRTIQEIASHPKSGECVRPAVWCNVQKVIDVIAHEAAKVKSGSQLAFRLSRVAVLSRDEREVGYLFGDERHGLRFGCGCVRTGDHKSERLRRNPLPQRGLSQVHEYGIEVRSLNR